MRKFLAVVLTITALCWHQHEGAAWPETAPGAGDSRPEGDSGLAREISVPELVTNWYRLSTGQSGFPA